MPPVSIPDQAWNACLHVQVYLWTSNGGRREYPTTSFHNLVATYQTWQDYYNQMERTSRLRKYHFGIVHVFYAIMGGFVFDTSCNDETASATESTGAHNTRDVPEFETFIYIMRYFPHIIPDISEDSITDRAESSGLSKALLVIQIGWFCTNCVARLIQRLPLSLLEVSTISHAICTFLTYFAWWSKPLNIAEGTTMRGTEALEVYALLMCSAEEYSEALRIAQRMAAGDRTLVRRKTVRNSRMPKISIHKEKTILAANALRHLLPVPKAPPQTPFRNHHGMSAPGSIRSKAHPNALYDYIAIALSPVLYGLVHFLVWSHNFPTPLEHLFWRASTIVVTFSGLFWVPLALGLRRLEERYAKSENGCAKFITVVALIPVGLVVQTIPIAYIVASAFLIAESLRQLFFLDPAVYQPASWPNYLPHVS